VAKQQSMANMRMGGEIARAVPNQAADRLHGVSAAARPYTSIDGAQTFNV
jgi:hypothetical protein